MRGSAAVLVLLGIVLFGGGAWGLSKTKFFHGDSKRAKTATETTETLIATAGEQNGKAAAVFAKIGETNAEAPESPQKRVISRFVPIGMGFTGQPDPAFMLELEKLKVATLAGKLEQADKINATLMTDAADTRRELAKAVAGKRASDAELVQVAAERLGAEQQAFWFTLVAVAAVVLWAYVKLTHLSPGALATAVADIRNGTGEQNASIAAIDSVTSPTQQMMVRSNVWLKSKLGKLFS